MNYDYRNFAKAIKNAGFNHLEQSSSINESRYVNEYSEHGVCTIAVDKLNIRNKPSLDGEVVGSYDRGESVTYDYVIDNDGYRWIRWIGAPSGKYRYMAVRDLKTNKRLGYCK